MSNENEWLTEKQLKDSDILTFTNSYKFVKSGHPFEYTYTAVPNSKCD